MQLGHARFARQIDAQGQGVDEEADQALDLARGRGWPPGVPITRSCWPDRRPSTAAQAPSRVMEQRRAMTLGQALAGPSVELLVQLDRQIAAREVLLGTGAAGRWAAPAAPERRPGWLRQ